MLENKIIVEVNDLTNSDFENSLFFDIVESTIEKSGIECLKRKKISISLALVAPEEMQKLNSQCRNKNEVTDVLSFSEFGADDLCQNKEEEIYLGEIVICPSYIEKSSVLQNVTFEYELAYIVSHGVLHLLGFLHSEKMFSLQEDAVKKVLNKK
ncbi:MAG: hypothetical protein ACD_11C00030G0002 [uncultured bacterium]|nr:MAG: hypothetical protein ACD_11C00030G0002 [uncultured bacterium]HBR72009.1 rRNA maturation RNase YbeY [Candidatus Moranbacteria bacterium]